MTAAAPMLAAALALSLAAVAWCARRWRREAQESRRLRELALWRADQVAMLSHELRTPLTLIQLSGDLLADGEPGSLGDDQIRFVETIRQQTGAMIGLTEAMLLQARIESGKFTLHLTAWDFGQLVLGAVNDLRGICASPLILDCPSGPCRIYADALLIRQALTNLVNNAVAVSPPGAPVTVRVARREYDILVSVSDEGAGMTAARRLELFRRFTSGRPLASGTGLGLVIVKQIVELHGGRLFVDTAAGQGTTMLFDLPIEGPAERKLP
ncbi:MAG: HAMP domain-containing histidine kinase [Propionibacteriaceae bacterium]|nr:HAMP domain-containing histidine kinase [Propionibacteriaceae bacterium]